jgi:hypothetical protein
MHAFAGLSMALASIYLLEHLHLLFNQRTIYMNNKDGLMALFEEAKAQCANEATFATGIQQVLALRGELKRLYQYIFDTATPSAYAAMPIPEYSTITYYFYHLSRVEDLITNTLIREQPQLFYTDGYQAKMKSPIATTGNEITPETMVAFSSTIEAKALQEYILKLFETTNDLIARMSWEQGSRQVSDAAKANLIALQSVSSHQNAAWLVDSLCANNYQSLILRGCIRHLAIHLPECLDILKAA